MFSNQHTPALRATPLQEGILELAYPKGPLWERGARRAGGVARQATGILRTLSPDQISVSSAQVSEEFRVGFERGERECVLAPQEFGA